MYAAQTQRCRREELQFSLHYDVWVDSLYVLVKYLGRVHAYTGAGSNL
jgi:hypothetical protein